MAKSKAPTLTRRQRDPSAFIEEVLHDPETGKPFKLLDAERALLEHAFNRAAVEKSGHLCTSTKAQLKT
jgi:hypothetical protein